MVQVHYGAVLTEVDFRTAAEKARKKMNKWVSKETNGKIEDLIARGILDEDTRLVLTNAIYFLGKWNSEFDKEDTEELPFTFLDGKKADVPMMRQEEEFLYGESESLQIINLPYVGHDLSMVILLPKKNDGLKELEDEFEFDEFSGAVWKLEKREVKLMMPKFKMTSSFNLSEVLKELGMVDAFSTDADFSGMAKKEELFISEVIHKAYVDVNEEGTEAAAATAVMTGDTAIPPDERGPVVFTADHPFMFVIRDKRTGTILFMGRVADPRE